VEEENEEAQEEALKYEAEVQLDAQEEALKYEAEVQLDVRCGRQVFLAS
jgi:hypothetical protein